MPPAIAMVAHKHQADTRPIGRKALDTHGSTLPDGTLDPYAMVDSTRMLLDRLGRRRNIPQAVQAAQTMKWAMTATLANATAAPANFAAPAAPPASRRRWSISAIRRG